MAKVKISRIRIDYSDGTYDNIAPIQEDPILLYSLERNNTIENVSANGAYTHLAIAALLFLTAVSNEYINYKGYDPQVIKLLKCWSENNL
jgi:hypothetical protein